MLTTKPHSSTQLVAGDQKRSLQFQVCDEPHPLLIREMIKSCSTGDVDEAYKVLSHLWYMGYAAEDIITNIFRVCKNYQMSEYLKLEFIKVRYQAVVG